MKVTSITARLRLWMLAAALVGQVPGAWAQSASAKALQFSGDGLLPSSDCYPPKKCFLPDSVIHTADQNPDPRLVDLREMFGRVQFAGNDLDASAISILKAPELANIVIKHLKPGVRLTLTVFAHPGLSPSAAQEQSRARMESLRRGLQNAKLPLARFNLTAY